LKCTLQTGRGGGHPPWGEDQEKRKYPTSESERREGIRSLSHACPEGVKKEFSSLIAQGAERRSAWENNGTRTFFFVSETGEELLLLYSSQPGGGRGGKGKTEKNSLSFSFFEQKPFLPLPPPNSTSSRGEAVPFLLFLRAENPLLNKNPFSDRSPLLTKASPLTQKGREKRLLFSLFPSHEAEEPPEGEMLPFFSSLPPVWNDLPERGDTEGKNVNHLFYGG